MAKQTKTKDKNNSTSVTIKHMAPDLYQRLSETDDLARHYAKDLPLTRGQGRGFKKQIIEYLLAQHLDEIKTKIIAEGAAFLVGP